ncbi:hypothetical protein PJ311_19020 [Bacillus sp. CLL-7-23]|uniref:Uncharacterized protein n=1 Tax=Bacillus changyiensis TaxID=3004103 RepID=A0ABT4XAZ2_9BACI|nr:hypothetical protein [Bacillus changyiensis]MDA7028627.1 hypothetical protein [Bacillus changyiensis]
MKITVNEQTQRFYLAFKRWVPVIGHEIKMGKYRFCAIPLNGHINITEVNSGCKAFVIPMNVANMLETESKEGTMNFLYRVGESLERIIGTRENFDEELKEMKKLAFERLGEMPSIEDVNTDWIFEDESEVLN